ETCSDPSSADAGAASAAPDVNSTATRAGSSDSGRSMAPTVAVRESRPDATQRRPGRVRPIEFPVVSDVTLPPLQISEVQRSVGRELDRIAPVIDELGRRFLAAGHELALV